MPVITDVMVEAAAEGIYRKLVDPKNEHPEAADKSLEWLRERPVIWERYLIQGRAALEAGFAAMED